jgi:hypothetical protein
LLRKVDLRVSPGSKNEPGKVTEIYGYLRSISRLGVNIVKPEGKEQEEKDKDKDVPTRRREDNLDFWQRARRWQLKGALLVAIALLGFLFGKLATYQTKEDERVQAAILDAPSKYQIRLSERVADIEGRQRAHEASDAAQAAAVTSLGKVVNDLAVQVGRLTVAINKEKRDAQNQ